MHILTSIARQPLIYRPILPDEISSCLLGRRAYLACEIQSGHGDGADDLLWLVKGPPATAWRNQPSLPVINLEPNYETAYGYQHKTVFNDFHVRRAAYWSLLVHPAAGLTFGHDAVWNWNFETGPSEGHGDWHDGAVPPWHTGLKTPGVHSMTVLRGILERLDWTTLKPYQLLLAEQPGDRDVKSFIGAGRNANGTVVVYSPLGEPLFPFKRTKTVVKKRRYNPLFHTGLDKVYYWLYRP